MYAYIYVYDQSSLHYNNKTTLIHYTANK